MEPDRPPTARPEESFNAGIRVSECIVYHQRSCDYAVNTVSFISGADLHSSYLQLTSMLEANELQISPTMERTAPNTLGQTGSEMYLTTASKLFQFLRTQPLEAQDDDCPTH